MSSLNSSVLGQSLGAIELGVLCSSILYGAMLVQVYNYYQLKFEDSLPIRLILYCVVTMETVYVIFIYTYVYRATIVHFGDLLGALHDTWSMSISLTVAIVVTSAVQLFFTKRLRGFTQNIWLPLLAWMGILARIATTVALTVLLYKHQALELFIKTYEWLIILNFSLGAAIDTFNTVCLCFYLSKQKARFRKTQRIVDKMIIWTIETGLLTSVSAILIIILLTAMSNNTIFVFFVVNSARLYANCLLASLNGRATLFSPDVITTGQITTGAFRHSRDGANEALRVEVHVDVNQSGDTPSGSNLEMGDLNAEDRKRVTCGLSMVQCS